MTLLKICEITFLDIATISDIIETLKIKEKHTPHKHCIAYTKIDTSIILRYIYIKKFLTFESSLN